MKSLLWPYFLCSTNFSSVDFGLPQAPSTLLSRNYKMQVCLNSTLIANFWKSLPKPLEFDNDDTASSVDGKHLENDQITTIVWFSCPSFLQADFCAFKVLGVLCYGKHLMRQVKGTVQPLFSNSSGVTSLNGASDFHPSRSNANTFRFEFDVDVK